MRRQCRTGKTRYDGRGNAERALARRGQAPVTVRRATAEELAGHSRRQRVNGNGWPAGDGFYDSAAAQDVASAEAGETQDVVFGDPEPPEVSGEVSGEDREG